MHFEGFSQNTLDFMWGIRFNNERSWFEAHKQDYLEHLYDPMKALCLQTYNALEEECVKRGIISRVCRIYRDARRLHGRGPYKDHLWFVLERPAEPFTAHPTFWFELTPEEWSYGLGYYAARSITMAKLRARMDHNPDLPLSMLAQLERQGEFSLNGPSYKKEKISPIPALSPWYNKKSFSFHHTEPLTEKIYMPEFAQYLITGFRQLFPLYDYLITLDSDPAPPEYKT